MATPTLPPYSDQESEVEIEVFEAGADDARNIYTMPHEWQIETSGTTPMASPIKMEPRLYRSWKPKSPKKSVHDRKSPQKSSFRNKEPEQSPDEQLPANLPTKRLNYDACNNNGNMRFLIE